MTNTADHADSAGTLAAPIDASRENIATMAVEEIDTLLENLGQELVAEDEELSHEKLIELAEQIVALQATLRCRRINARSYIRDLPTTEEEALDQRIDHAEKLIENITKKLKKRRANV